MQAENVRRIGAGIDLAWPTDRGLAAVFGGGFLDRRGWNRVLVRPARRLDSITGAGRCPRCPRRRVRLHADLAWDRGGGRPRSKRSRLPAAVEEDAAVRIAGLGFEFAGMESL